jgi:putative nucleotidyltransferase with HDIG domain
MSATALAQEVKSLLSLPDAVMRLNALIDDPKAGTADIAEVIAHDPGLAASLLKLVNSAYYGFPGTISSIARAADLIGRNELRSLALACGMAEVFKGIPSGIVDMETFWFNSVTCGTLAKLLAQRCRADRDALFTAGLLHGIGRLVFYLRRPEQYRDVLVRCGEQTEANLNAWERRVFGFDHAELGAELCRQWGLPEHLCQILRHHLAPAGAGDDLREASLLHV